MFLKPQSGWTNANQTAKLLSSNGAGLGPVSVSNNTVAAGASKLSQSRGAIYVFVRPTQGWRNMTQTAILSASDGKANDDLGSSISNTVDTIIAGAPGKNHGQGSVYVFVRPAAGWSNITENAQLGIASSKQAPFFGLSVSISHDGSTILGGAPTQLVGSRGQGAVYSFTKPSGGWHTTSAPHGRLGVQNGALFGTSTSISDKIVVVGADGQSLGNSSPGAAFVFGSQ